MPADAIRSNKANTPAVEKPPQASTTSVPPPAPKQNTHGTDASFQICVGLVDRILCVDVLPEPPKHLNLQQWQSLILSVLRVCGLASAPQKIPDPSMLLWPPKDAVALMRREPERAKQYLKNELNARFKTSTRMLVFGTATQGEIVEWIKACVPQDYSSDCFMHSPYVALNSSKDKMSLWDELRAIMQTPKHWF